MGCHTFLQISKLVKNWTLKLELELILLRTFLVLGSKQTNKQKCRSQQVEFETCEIKVIQNMFDKDVSLSLMVHA